MKQRYSTIVYFYKMKSVKHNLADIRREYTSRTLSEQDIASSPFEQFERWFREAMNSQLPEPSAMALSTVSASGKPSCRIVLLKSYSEEGFYFFTNYNSRKGIELNEHPCACLTFFWPELERQVRIEGSVKKISREDSESYFHSRPRLSQLGARSSPQSELITSQQLQKNFEEEEKKWEGKEVKYPEYWGGYSLNPDYFEFWQGRPGRLHDRVIYTADNAQWKTGRLAP